MLKRTAGDRWFSDCVRERAGSCERCGRSQRLECSHVFGRASYGVRHHPDNAMALCHGCHRYFTSHPVEHTDFWRAKVGPEVEAEVVRCRNDQERARYARRNDKEIADHYREEYRRLASKRSRGKGGYIEFEGWKYEAPCDT